MSTGSGDFDYGSATVPTGAVFVAADGGLLVFPSASAAECWIEANDVGNVLRAEAWGPNGEPRRIGRAGRRVVIEPTGEAGRPEDLRPLLLQYLVSRGEALGDDAPTASLVQQVWRCEREFWLENDPYGDRFSRPAPLSCCVALIVVPPTFIYVLVTRDWMAIPAITVVTLLIGGIAALAQRRAEQLDFRRR